ncbi:MAG: Jag N-terminal domain-containing protein [Christensenellales bacterium]
MRSIDVTAKSVDEAIFMGIDQLGLSIDQVDIEIIEEGGRRLFGIGSKQCVVRLTERARKKWSVCWRNRKNKRSRKSSKNRNASKAVPKNAAAEETAIVPPLPSQPC